MKARTESGKGLPPFALVMRFSSSGLTVRSPSKARCTPGVVGLGCLGASCYGEMAGSGIAMTFAAIASASCSYLSPGLLTVSFA